MKAQARRNMEEDEAWTDNWVRDGEGKIKTKRVKLDRIVDDSSRLYPPVNVRNLNQTVINGIKDSLLANKGELTPAIAMRYGKLYCIPDGNQKQLALKQLCKEQDSDTVEIFRLDKIPIKILKGNAISDDVAAWRAYALSFRKNSLKMSTLERVIAIGYGRRYYMDRYDKRSGYIDHIKQDFGIKGATISSHVKAHELLRELEVENANVYHEFLEKYKFTKCPAFTMYKKLKRELEKLGVK